MLDGRDGGGDSGNNFGQSNQGGGSQGGGYDSNPQGGIGHSDLDDEIPF